MQSLILRRGEKKIYQKSSALLAANISMQRYVGELVGPNHAPCSVLDHGVDTDHFRRLSPSSEILDSLGISRAAIVGVFLGTTYSFSRLDQFIGHIKLIREKVPNFVLLIDQNKQLIDSTDKLKYEKTKNKFLFYLKCCLHFCNAT